MFPYRPEEDTLAKAEFERMIAGRERALTLQLVAQILNSNIIIMTYIISSMITSIMVIITNPPNKVLVTLGTEMGAESERARAAAALHSTPYTLHPTPYSL